MTNLTTLQQSTRDKFDDKFDAMYKAGYGSDMRLIKDFLEDKISLAYSLAHEELIEKVKVMKKDLLPFQVSIDGNGYTEAIGFNKALDGVLKLLTPKE